MVQHRIQHTLRQSVIKRGNKKSQKKWHVIRKIIYKWRISIAAFEYQRVISIQKQHANRCAGCDEKFLMQLFKIGVYKHIARRNAVKYLQNEV